MLDDLPTMGEKGLSDDMKAWRQGLNDLLARLPFWEAVCVQAASAGGSVEALRKAPLPAVGRALVATVLK